MSKNWDNVFKKVFLDSNVSSFSDKQDVVYTFKTFKKLRDAESHGRNIDQSDKQMGEAAALKLKTFIEKFNEAVAID